MSVDWSNYGNHPARVHTPLKVMDVENATLYGSSGRAALRHRNLWSLMLGFHDMSMPDPFNVPPLVQVSGGADKFVPPHLYTLEDVPSLLIHCDDYGAPCMSQAWWIDVCKTILTIDGAVVVHCGGGIGRTGTALSIITHFLRPGNAESCPVTWVRKNYYHGAVESEEQLEYIERITGAKVDVMPSDFIMGYLDGREGAQASRPAQKAAPKKTAKKRKRGKR